MCKELFFHHGRLPVQTLSHPALSRQVMGRRAGATSNRGLPGRSCGLSPGMQERALTPDPGAQQQQGPSLASLGGLRGRNVFLLVAALAASQGGGRRPVGGSCLPPLLQAAGDTAPGAVYRPVNEPRLWGRLERGQRSFSESWQGSGLLDRGREEKERGESGKLSPGKPALQAHSPPGHSFWRKHHSPHCTNGETEAWKWRGTSQGGAGWSGDVKACVLAEICLHRLREDLNIALGQVRDCQCISP